MKTLLDYNHLLDSTHQSAYTRLLDSSDSLAYAHAPVCSPTSLYYAHRPSYTYLSAYTHLTTYIHLLFIFICLRILTLLLFYSAFLFGVSFYRLPVPYLSLNYLFAMVSTYPLTVVCISLCLSLSDSVYLYTFIFFPSILPQPFPSLPLFTLTTCSHFFVVVLSVFAYLSLSLYITFVPFPLPLCRVSA